ncbi:hypothetical protein L861_02250 [Litchfieldella anticariensis FP35 = DSM 16096]|uniref:Polysaccharide pyruvyl transferase domain-containing protein n=1 Tax=Litchfieldella anticariensis (strain DSM 16096 / CECT 5854 / CIP 108499 / LMG 22089 / FP35) TaxID=1121939 RepID=S2KQJ4_LITA3|nr:polysaccharide pyruvyl transferase family protein [Halomonas anticariensis]EPC04155.1 hypothetical protein L861_02250 [Halomonas anticariensis FP35 = DSM 16096]
MKVALVSGFWAQNIGNAFFNIGGKWALEQVFGENNVQFVQDRPPYRTFYDQMKGDPENYVKLHEMLDVEYLVLQGPMLTKTFPHIWGEAFKKLKERGVKIMLHGAAFFKYNDEEVAAVRAFLEKYPPHLISTRDEDTYNVIKDWPILTYNGLDSAFFVPKVFKPLKFNEPYYAFNFDRFPEPTVYLGNHDQKKDASFTFENEVWNLKTPKVQQYFSLKGKSQAYLGHLLDRRKLPSSLLGKKIIRPEHRYVPHMTHKIYQHPNSFVSDEVFTYLSVYANSTMTLADRVHACVMTLAYGNPAMLFTISPRQALFKRVGAHDIRNRPVTIDLDYLESERVKQIEFLKANV